MSYRTKQHGQGTGGRVQGLDRWRHAWATQVWGPQGAPWRAVPSGIAGGARPRGGVAGRKAAIAAAVAVRSGERASVVGLRRVRAPCYSTGVLAQQLLGTGGGQGWHAPCRWPWPCSTQRSHRSCRTCLGGGTGMVEALHSRALWPFQPQSCLHPHGASAARLRGLRHGAWAGHAGCHRLYAATLGWPDRIIRGSSAEGRGMREDSVGRRAST